MSTMLVRYQLDRPALTVITSESQLDQYTNALIELEGRGHLSTEDKKYARLLAALIERYESKYHAIPEASPLEVLQELIEANNLKQKDLATLFGTESVVSEIVNGKRPLSKTHIEKLSARFKVSPAIFFERAHA